MKRVKDAIASLLYKVVLLAVKLLPARKGHKHLLVIKLDEIGDYMLFRNMLAFFKQSEKYKGYRITLLGNEAWKPIFDVYDKNAVDNVIWLAKKKFNKSLSYRFSILKQVRQLRTSDVVNYIFSRSIILDDGFALVATGDEKIAMKGNNANRGKYAINLDSAIYTRVVDPGDEKLFESIRNANFARQILGVQPSPSVRLNVVDAHTYAYAGYFAVFIGAGNKPQRKWPVENFVKCAEFINDKYGLMPIVCGGPPDEPDAAKFIQLYKKEAINLAGKTTLPGFIELVSKAKFLLSVDTGPVHMAAAAGCPVVGLYSGMYYGRYAPYPKEAAYPFYSIYSYDIDALVAANDTSVFDPFAMKDETIREIPVEKVLPYFEKVMGGN
jgi:ADP-heptose:LPS heptosyltransferase